MGQMETMDCLYDISDHVFTAKCLMGKLVFRVF